MLFRNSGPSPSLSHWSKDFAEHLRTVHFTLIGVATGLILIVLSAKPYSAGIALRQIHQIIELKKMWSPNWLASKGERKVVASNDDMPQPQTWTRFVNAGFTEFVADARWEQPHLPGERPRMLLSKEPISIQFSLLNKNWIQFSIFNKNWMPVTHPDWSPDTFPSTLGDFRQWWDRLGNDNKYKVDFPETIVDGLIWKGKYRVGLVTATVDRLSYSKKVGVSLRENYKYVGLGLDKYEFRIPVYEVRSVEISQQMLATYFGWSVGPFSTAFLDLSHATQDVEAFELDEIEKIISNDAAKGSEVFEAFGMKFPAGQITLWGIVILLGVQLYFFIYLKQLSGKLSPNDAAWDVPWLGMDTSFLARVTFFLTVVLLPLAALGTLSGHAISQLSKLIRWDGWTVAKTFGLVAVLIPALILALLSWKYRPKLEGAAKLPDIQLETAHPEKEATTTPPERSAHP